MGVRDGSQGWQSGVGVRDESQRWESGMRVRGGSQGCKKAFKYLVYKQQQL